MSTTADLLLRNLKPWSGTATVDLAVVGGRFVSPAAGMTG